jgi:hypothetical protein
LRLGRAAVEVRAEHLEKLRYLYDHHHRGSQGSNASSASSNESYESYESYESRFHLCAFACIARVVSSQGGSYRIAGGHHAALPAAVFDVLRYGSLQVEAEVFASPLNCRYTTFCSAFRDVDKDFGSLGSFFEFSPRDGSFEVNPPFETALVSRVAARLERNLRAAEKRSDALSFVVIVPYWPNREAWEALKNSAFRVEEPLIVPAGEHGYFDGAQHWKRSRFKPATCDTSVYYLQTTRGRARYPPTEETIEALREAFRMKFD